MTAPSVTETIELLRANLQRQRFAGFAPHTLLWHAALPEWTDTLAVAAGFPTGPAATLPDLLTDLASAGLAQVRAVLADDGTMATAFWLPASRRAEVGAHLRATMPVSAMLGVLADLDQRLAARTPLSPGAVALRQVLRLHGTDVTGSHLLATVDDLLADERPEQATELVAAAQCLGELVGEPLASAARRAQWRLDRAYREAIDTRALKCYQPRADLESALRELVSGSTGWALHLRGDGGMGKTMAVRYLASGQLSARLGLPELAVARVDFDHLDPRYPDRRPAELLLALAADLVGHTATRAAQQHRRSFDDAAFALHEASLEPERPGIATDLFEAALDAFARYLHALQKPVVLVLDTCEELAKLHAPGGPAPIIDRTFAILEGVHARSPDTRVVLAGRRWLVPRPDGGPADAHLTARPYLTVVEVGGFTDQEAAAYLDRRDPDGRIPPRLRSALLRRCTPAKPATVNPFELAAYTGWALDDPHLDEGTLTDAPGDPYVEQRIIGRISDVAVRGALPVAVELGRFDVDMIGPELRRRHIDPDAAFSGVAAQEWVSAVTFDADGRPRIIQIDENLLPRLRRVIAAQSSDSVVDRHRLGSDVAALALDRSVEELPAEVVESTLRLLPVAEAAAWWVRLDERIVADGAWGWAAQITPRAAAVEADRALRGGPTILAAVRATQAAATLRQPGRPGLTALWEDVQGWADWYPDPTAAQLLRARGVCGRLAADPIRTPLGLYLDELLRYAPGDAVLAAAEALTAATPTGALPDLTGLDDLLARAADGPLPPALRAAARLVLADLRRRGGAVDQAVAHVEAALDELTGSPPPRQCDWVLPARLVDRARLARVRLAMARAEPPDALPLARWRAEARSYLSHIDSERLVAATLDHELDWRPVARATLDDLVATDSYEPNRRPGTGWHRITAPLMAALARGFVAVGDPGPAASLVRARREAAIGHGEDPDTVEQADLILARLCRQARTVSFTASLPRLAREGSSAVREHAWPALLLVRGQRPTSVEDAGAWHTWWQTSGARSRSADPPATPALDDSWRAAEQADLLERGDAVGDPLATTVGGVQESRLVAELLDDRSGRTLGAVLRVLTGPTGLPAGASSAAALAALTGGDGGPGLPPRFLAEAAFADGELLALRYPTRGAELLAISAAAFARAGDRHAATRAGILAILATARAGAPVVDPPPYDQPWQGPPRGQPGWLALWRRAGELAAGGGTTPAPAARSAMPELDVTPPKDAPGYGDPQDQVSRTGTASAASPGPPPAETGSGIGSAPWTPLPPSPAPTEWQRPAGAGGGSTAPPQQPPGAPAAGSPPAVPSSPTAAPRSAPAAPAAQPPAAPFQRPEPPPPVGARRGSRPAPAGTPRADLSRAATAAGLTGTVVGLTSLVVSLTSYSSTAAPNGAVDDSTLLGVVIAVVALAAAMFVWTSRHWRRPTPAPPRQVLRTAYAYRPEQPEGRWLRCLLQVDDTAVRLRADDEQPADGGAPSAGFLAGDVVVPLLLASPADVHPWEADTARQRPGAYEDPLFVRFALPVDASLPLAHHWLPGIGAATAFDGPAEMSPPARGSSGVDPGAWAVWHLVGTPVLTKGGWRLRVRRQTAGSDEYTGRSTWRGETLVGVDELPGSRTGLLVLQAEPAGYTAEPLADQREGMFALAGEALLAGVGAVLVVPPLPDRAAVEVVLAAQTMLVDADRPAPWSMFELTRNVRELTRDRWRLTGGGHTAAPEYDVVLMLSTDQVPEHPAFPRFGDFT